MGQAFSSWVIPAIGFFIAPWTTVAYAFMWGAGKDSVSGFWEWAVVGIAVLLDLAHLVGDRPPASLMRCAPRAWLTCDADRHQQKDRIVDELKGKVAFVTGASRGIGAAVARRLSEAGAALGLASRSGEGLGLPRTIAQPVDVRDLGALESLAAATAERFGGIDIVVANAGVGAYGPFEEIDLEQLEAMIDVNLRRALSTRLGRRCPYLLRSEAADFVSLATRRAAAAYRARRYYCASKFGQVGFTRALEGELRERGVRCTSVCPGGVHTEFALGTGRTPDMPILNDMMSADDVADVVMHVLTRPRHMRILETAFRPMTEASWG